MLRRARAEKRLVWIFGSPRSGSTWLLNLLAQDPDVAKVEEPSIGVHLGVSGDFVTGLPVGERLLDMRSSLPHYFFSDMHRPDWARPLRDLLLRRLTAAAPKRRWVVIKEPDGGEAADLILSLLPRSRLIFLLRDGRDVVDSQLDAVSDGGWVLRALGDHPPLRDRLSFIRERADTWRRRTEVVRTAFEAHDPGLRMMVRYEDLLADPVGGIVRVGEWLGLDSARLIEGVDRLALERVTDRGPGRFVRAASPGLWRENLSESEQAVLEEVLGETLAELGYRGGAAAHPR